MVDIDELGAGKARLIITSESLPEGPFATLSHCWGSSLSLKLTSDNLFHLKQQIVVADLPLTFTEAFEVTRRLGLRYIWIDSLCIMQDSKEDWLHEAAIMHKLLRHRDAHVLYPVEVEIPWYGDNKDEKYQLIDYNFWSSQILDQPLHRRGWVVQERLLAPRVLHFSAQQLIWECRELDAAEKYPTGLPPPLANSAQALFKGLDPEKDGSRLRKLSGQDPDPRFWAHQCWNKIAEAYTSSLLTFGDDKLIAPSGIAKRMQAELGDEYVAGLWRGFLPSQLTWWVENGRQIDNSPAVRLATYRAPSWSWASVDGMINTGGFADDGFIIDIVEVSITPATADPTGILESGFLRVWGVLKKLELRRHEFFGEQWWMTVNGVEVRKQADEVWNTLGTLVFPDVHEPDFKGIKYCFPVQELFEHNSFTTGLILETTGNSKGQFRRIGLFRATSEVHHIVMARNESESTLPCERFDSETRTHTICIV